MRIAVSGTHCSGKTTLIEEFLRVHPEFAHEPEAYAALVEDYGEEFSAEPGADDFFRQLEFNVERVKRYALGERVIFERSPIDYLAYLLALKDLKRDEVDALVETAQALIPGAIRNLDLIVFLPLNKADRIDLPDSEDPKLRRAVDSRLVAIFNEDEFGVSSGGPKIIETNGTPAQRLRMVESAMESGTRH
jgi:hypothetical protein